ncbi:MAG: hypothetical protein AAB702_02185 [Patescibacteria group bacterium]
MKKPVLIIATLVFVILTLSVVRIFISNNISTSGVVLGKVGEELDKYKLENSITAEKLYTMASLTSVSQKAYTLGFVDSKSDFVLNQKVPVAIKQ